MGLCLALQRAVHQFLLLLTPYHVLQLRLHLPPPLLEGQGLVAQAPHPPDRRVAVEADLHTLYTHVLDQVVLDRVPVISVGVIELELVLEVGP